MMSFLSRLFMRRLKPIETRVEHVDGDTFRVITTVDGKESSTEVIAFSDEEMKRIHEAKRRVAAL